MLNNELYKIIGNDQKYGIYSFGLELNAAHPIFKGHYPDQPVMPGACLLAIIVEICNAEIFSQKRKLKRVLDMKFLVPINPLETNQLLLDINWMHNDAGETVITAKYSQAFSKTVSCKCTAVFSAL